MYLFALFTTPNCLQVSMLFLFCALLVCSRTAKSASVTDTLTRSQATDRFKQENDMALPLTGVLSYADPENSLHAILYLYAHM